MDSRNFVNSEHYTKLLREKAKRETKIAKMQSKLQQEQQKLSLLRPLSEKRPKKLDERWLNERPQKPEETNVLRRRPPISPVAERKKLSSVAMTTNAKSNNDNDLLSEIDNSLSGGARGFVYKKGN
jgi:hypothetical protein